MTSGDQAQITKLMLELADAKEFLEQNPGPVCRLDKKGKIIVANKPAELFFGQNELTGLSWLDICPGINNEQWAEILRSGNADFEIETNNKTILFSYVCSDTKDFVFVFGTDISSQKKIEKNLAGQAAIAKDMARFPEMNP